MQELIEELDLSKIVEKHNFFMVKYIIQQCLEKEKEQIMQSYNDGYVNKAFDRERNPLEYYNRTYNQNK